MRAGQRKQRRRGVVDVAFERRHRRHRVVVEIELVLVDQARQRIDRQAVVADHLQQFGRDRIAFDAAMARAGQHVGPPLQPHLAGQRLADLLAHARNLDIEGVDREQRAALGRRHEQRRCVADEIMGAHQIGAEAGGVLRAPRLRSWHRDQRRGDAPALAHHDVVGADRRPRLHRVQHHPHRAQRLAQMFAAASRRRCRCRRPACRSHWPT